MLYNTTGIPGIEIVYSNPMRIKECKQDSRDGNGIIPT